MEVSCHAVPRPPLPTLGAMAGQRPLPTVLGKLPRRPEGGAEPPEGRGCPTGLGTPAGPLPKPLLPQGLPAPSREDQ